MTVCGTPSETPAALGRADILRFEAQSRFTTAQGQGYQEEKYTTPDKVVVLCNMAMEPKPPNAGFLLSAGEAPEALDDGTEKSLPGLLGCSVTKALLEGASEKRGKIEKFCGLPDGGAGHLCQYLYVEDEAGHLMISPACKTTTKDSREAQEVCEETHENKHGDLTPGSTPIESAKVEKSKAGALNAHGWFRGPARDSGELVYMKALKAWYVDNKSGYTLSRLNRRDAERAWDEVKKLLAMKVSDLMPTDMPDRLKQFAVPADANKELTLAKASPPLIKAATISEDHAKGTAWKLMQKSELKNEAKEQMHRMDDLKLVVAELTTRWANVLHGREATSSERTAAFKVSHIASFAEPNHCAIKGNCDIEGCKSVL